MKSHNNNMTMMSHNMTMRHENTTRPENKTMKCLHSTYGAQYDEAPQQYNATSRLQRLTNHMVSKLLFYDRFKRLMTFTQ